MPRRVSNDVGAAVTSPVTILKGDQQIPVLVWVSWDDGEPELVPGMCRAYTHEFAGVHIRDPQTGLSYNAWVPASDVQRREDSHEP